MILLSPGYGHSVFYHSSLKKDSANNEKNILPSFGFFGLKYIFIMSVRSNTQKTKK